MELRDMLDYQTLIDAFPYYAMVLDEDHRLVAANSYFTAETGAAPEPCLTACFEVVHEAEEAPSDCPLTEAIRTDKTAERVMDSANHGKLRVSVYPLMSLDKDGKRLFLHLARPAQLSGEAA